MDIYLVGAGGDDVHIRNCRLDKTAFKSGVEDNSRGLDSRDILKMLTEAIAECTFAGIAPAGVSVIVLYGIRAAKLCGKLYLFFACIKLSLGGRACAPDDLNSLFDHLE